MADDDPYRLLGVARDASAEDVRRAFRAAAKQSHPDLHPGDKEAEARFKALSAANEVLGDPERRAQYDRGEIDGGGNPKARPPPPGGERSFYRGFADSPGAARYAARGAGRGAGAESVSDDELGDILGAFFNRGAGGGGAGGEPMRVRGEDRQYRLDVTFLEAVRGATKRLTLPGGKFLDVGIPAGLEDGQVLRLRGQGGAGMGGAADGDAMIEASVLPHPVFRRDGRDVRVELPVSVREAVLGAKVAVPTPAGTVSMAIPARSEAGAVLRLRGRGVAAGGGKPAGDCLVTVRLVLGPVDARLKEFLRGWEQPGFDPRAADDASGSASGAASSGEDSG